jgi:hypothetical protein
MTMYRPTVRYHDIFRDYINSLFHATHLDRNQLIRGALFAAAQSKEFQALLKPYQKKDVPLPFSLWKAEQHRFWLEQSPGILGKVGTSMLTMTEQERLIRILELLKEEQSVHRKIDIADRQRDDQGPFLPNESASRNREKLSLRSIRLVRGQGKLRNLSGEGLGVLCQGYRGVMRYGGHYLISNLFLKTKKASFFR